MGIGELVRSETNPRAPYSENEIYQHITNCQAFFSYNGDETKLLKRRQAFKSSASFLFTLAKGGNAYEASRWTISRWVRDNLGALLSFGKKEKNPMRELGFRVAHDIFEIEKDSGKAAAILLLIALDSAYNSVIAVSFGAGTRWTSTPSVGFANPIRARSLPLSSTTSFVGCTSPPQRMARPGPATG